MKKFIEEFKKFALKGNALDLAVGMIIGSAFTGIVTSLTSNLIQPILDFITRAHPALYTKEEILSFISAFISSVVNFFIIALVLFLIVKGLNYLMSLHTKKEKEKSKLTKICPYCKSEIHIDAVKCPHCTSDIESE